MATDPANGLAGNPAVNSVTAEVRATGESSYCHLEVNWSTPGMEGPAWGYAEGEKQEINIVIGLPSPENWTGRLIMTSTGGSQGSLPNITSHVQTGAIGAGTDSGHGPGSGFGVIQEANTLNYGKLADWGEGRSHGVGVRLAKVVADTYYGEEVAYTYWSGFSGGGHMGWTQVQHFPEEYDGALIGAPANHWQQFRLADSWDEVVRKKVAQLTDPITAGQSNAANAAATAACDGLDGVVDGIVGDPRACTWSATNNICDAPGAPAPPNCLNLIQAEGFDRIWDGPRNSKGVRIWHPYDRGINLGVGTNTQGSTNQVMQWNRADMTFPANNLYEDQESIDLAAAAGVDVSQAVTYEEEAVLTTNTTSDYSDAFMREIDAARQAGVKIILYHGTQDGAIYYRNAVDHYRRIANYFGGGRTDFAGIQDWFRFFMVPGAGHSGQPFISQLADWVENGVAPDRIERTSGFPVVCPFPQYAIYDGSGDTSAAESYTCGGNLDANPVALCQMLRPVYKAEDGLALNYNETGIAAGDCAIRQARVDLAGDHPLTGGDEDGSGSARLSFDQAGQVCFDIRVRGIGAVTGAAIHVGPSGVNGPTVVDLEIASNGLQGCVTGDTELVRTIRTSPTYHYLSVATADYPEGAVRAQLG